MTTDRKSLARLPAPPRAWVFLGAALACLCAFFAVVHVVYDGAGDGKVGPAPLDHPIAQFFEESRSRALTGRVMEVSALGSAPVLLVFALLAYATVLRARDRLGFLHLSIVFLGASVVSRLLQHVFERARPDNLLPFVVVTEGSFPSAHLFGATACYVTFAFFYARYVGGLRTEIACYALASVMVLAIGVTRIYLGAHHTTDVMGGIAGGAAWALLVAAVFSRWYREPAPRS